MLSRTMPPRWFAFHADLGAERGAAFSFFRIPLMVFLFYVLMHACTCSLVSFLRHQGDAIGLKDTRETIGNIKSFALEGSSGDPYFDKR